MTAISDPGETPETETELVDSLPPAPPPRGIHQGASRRLLGLALYPAGLGLVLIVTQLLFAVIAHGTPAAVLYQGLIDGLAAALTAAGLVVVYQASRIFNFAQMAIGGVGAQVAFELIRYERGVPFAATMVLAVVVSGAVGGGVDLLMRRFSRAPRLLATVFTVVVASFLGSVGSNAIQGLPFLPPEAERPLSQIVGVNSLAPFLPYSGLHYRVGHLPESFGFGQLVAIEMCVVALAAVAGFLRLTRVGTAIRALSSNAERASLLGISVAGVTTIVWIMAGALGGVSALAEGITGSPAAAYAFTPDALLPALAAAVLTRLRSIPAAVAAAVGISVLSDAAGFAFTDSATIVSVGLFVIILAGLALLRPESIRIERASVSWRMVSEPRQVPAALARLGAVRGTRWGLGILLLALAGLYPVVVNVRLIAIGSDMAVFGLVTLSLLVLTGWMGQVSLGQYAFVAVGAVVAGGLTAHAGVPFWFSVPIAAIICAVLAVLVGFPALRVPGLYLAVLTFALGALVDQVLFDPKIFAWLLPNALSRPSLFLLGFDNERNMYYLCLFILAAVLVVVVNLRRSRTGRLMVAARDNEADVRAMGVNTTRLKLTAFGIAGLIAGLAGGLYGFLLRSTPSGQFSADYGFEIFIFALIGGITSPVGALLGAALYELTSYFLTGNTLLTYIAGFATIGIIYIAPSGIMAAVTGARDSLLRIIAHRSGVDTAVEESERDLTIPLTPPVASAGLGAVGTEQRFRLRSRILGRGVQA